MSEVRERAVIDPARGGYSEEEIAAIYDLGRIYLENGNLKAAEIIMQGLVQVVPEFAPGWLGLCYVQLFNSNIEPALAAAKRAQSLTPGSPEAILFMVTCLLNAGDYQTAGTYLGEVSEIVESGAVTSPSLVRFFKAQLARYQAR